MNDADSVTRGAFVCADNSEGHRMAIEGEVLQTLVFAILNEMEEPNLIEALKEAGRQFLAVAGERIVLFETPQTKPGEFGENGYLRVEMEVPPDGIAVGASLRFYKDS